MRYFYTSLGLASLASAHTLFTTFHINGESQGDGTCVRLPTDHSTANSPIYPLNGDNMACGRDGQEAVPFVCSSPGGATITFEYREHPNGERDGVIDDGHKGPCSVYAKKVDDMFSDTAAGGGWFKIWEDGYNTETGTWCTDTLIQNNGLLSVDIPTGLPSGYYLFRPEVIALHAVPDNDPQFYHGCAQVFIEDGPDVTLEIPAEFEVSIPGYLETNDAGLTYNIYESELGEYPIPGPEVYRPISTASTVSKVQDAGLIPEDCLLRNDNWCAFATSPSNDVTTCWASVEECWDQSEVCWDGHRPSGGQNCEIWGEYCTLMSDQCEAENFDGPPPFELEQYIHATPGDIPTQYGTFEETDVGGGSGEGEGSAEGTSTAAVPSSTPAPEPTAPAPSPSISTIADPAPTDEPVPEVPDQTAPEVPDETVPEVPEEPAPEVPDETVPEPPTETGDGDAGALVVSLDGRCGGDTGQTCLGSSFGDCCSRKGKCGRKTRHCTCGCQPGFGECREPEYLL